MKFEGRVCTSHCRNLAHGSAIVFLARAFLGPALACICIYLAFKGQTSRQFVSGRHCVPHAFLGCNESYACGYLDHVYTSVPLGAGLFNVQRRQRVAPKSRQSRLFIEGNIYRITVSAAILNTSLSRVEGLFGDTIQDIQIWRNSKLYIVNLLPTQILQENTSYIGNLEVILNGPKVQVAMPNLFSVAGDVAVISANVGTGEWFDEDAQC